MQQAQQQQAQMQHAQMQQAGMPGGLQQLPPYLGGRQGGGALPGVGYLNLGLDAGAHVGQMGQYTGMPTAMMANVGGGVMQPVVVMPQVGMQGMQGMQGVHGV